MIVDRDEEVLPACLALRLASAIAGDAVAGPEDAAELLAVDVHEFARRRTLVADDLLPRLARHKPGAAVPTQDRVHGRRRVPERPPDHMRSFAKLFTGVQDRLLDARRSSPRRPMRPARAVAQQLATPSAIAPLRRGLARAADNEGGRRDAQPGADEITDTLTLTDGQDRICMKIHRSPPLGRDSLTSRTLGGLLATSGRQQRVWELHLDRER
jgi:hypothetical protein